MFVLFTTFVNPARSKGQVIFVGGWTISQFWHFWVAPNIVAVLEGILHKMFFKSGDYALANLLYYPVKNVMMGLELQWAAGKNNNFASDTYYNWPPLKGNAASDIKL